MFVEWTDGIWLWVCLLWVSVKSRAAMSSWMVLPSTIIASKEDLHFSGAPLRSNLVDSGLNSTSSRLGKSPCYMFPVAWWAHSNIVSSWRLMFSFESLQRIVMRPNIRCAAFQEKNPHQQSMYVHMYASIYPSVHPSNHLAISKASSGTIPTFCTNCVGYFSRDTNFLSHIMTVNCLTIFPAKWSSLPTRFYTTREPFFHLALALGPLGEIGSQESEW